LALSAIALVLPTPFASYYDLHDEHVLLISRFAAVFLMFMYIQLLIFQLYTHASVFAGEGEESAELASLSLMMSMMGLLVVTLLVTVFSEYLVKSIDGFTEASGISRTFVGIILLPIVGNAVEHVTAITVARKDKMDLAVSFVFPWNRPGPTESSPLTPYVWRYLLHRWALPLDPAPKSPSLSSH
jgi:Ca2+:H+ antiporter